MCKGVSQERFSRDSREQRTAEGKQFCLSREQRVVLFVLFAKAVSGIENDGIRCNRCCAGQSQTCSQTCAYEFQERIGREFFLSAPLVGTSSCVHQHHATSALGANACHLRIPGESADVV